MSSIKKRYITFTLMVILANILNAQPLRVFDYQGRLFMNNSPIADGQHTLTFSIYPSEIGGTALWSASKQITTNSGLFSVKLGDVTSIPEDVFRANPTLYVSMNFNSQELTPRLQITSVAYSIRSAYADEVADNSISADKIASGAVAGDKIAGSAIDASKLAANSVTADKVAQGHVVKSINGLKDAVEIKAGDNIAMSDDGQAITITATGGSGGGDITAVITQKGLTGGADAGPVSVGLDTVYTDSRYVNAGQQNSVTGTMIANSAITEAKIASGTVVTSLNGIKNAAEIRAGDNVSISTDQQIITITSIGGNGGGGDITAVRPGTGLSGGAESGVATLSLDTNYADGLYVNQNEQNSITGAMLTDNSISNAKLTSSAVTAAKVAPGQIVKGLNGLTDDVQLQAGTGIQISSNTGNRSITITNTGNGTPTGAQTGFATSFRDDVTIGNSVKGGSNIGELVRLSMNVPAAGYLIIQGDSNVTMRGNPNDSLSTNDFRVFIGDASNALIENSTIVRFEVTPWGHPEGLDRISIPVPVTIVINIQPGVHVFTLNAEVFDVNNNPKLFRKNRIVATFYPSSANYTN